MKNPKEKRASCKEQISKYLKIAGLPLLIAHFSLLICTACASSPPSNRSSKSEILVTRAAGYIYTRHIRIINDEGKQVFPGEGWHNAGVRTVSKKEDGREVPNTGGWYEVKGTVVIPVPDGTYTIDHASLIGRTGAEYFYLLGSTTVTLKNNRALSEIYRDRNDDDKVRVTKINLGAIFARIEAGASKAFKDINKTLPANLPPNAAIAVFPPAAVYGQEAEIALENLTIQFVNAGYTVVEKRRLEELLAEYDFQRSGLVGEPTLGELLGADAVIFSTLENDGKLNAWAVDTAKSTTLARSISSQSPRKGADLSLLVLPVSGGDNDEAATVTSFVANHFKLRDAFTVTGQSGSASLQRYSGPFTSLTQAQRNELRDTGAKAVFSGTVHQVGRKKMLQMTMYNTKGGYVHSMSMEYADALELWVKLQPAFNGSINNIPAQYALDMTASSARSISAHVRSQFGQGVDRAEAESLTLLFISDAVTLDYWSVRSFVDATRDMEAGKPAPEGSAQVDFNWSKSGGMTRLDVVADNQRFSLEYGSEREFIRKMRGLTVFVLPKVLQRRGNDPLGWGRPSILGHDGYDPLADNPAPVPANFTKLTRVASGWVGEPMGGFYIANAPVTQREYESVMGQNPSTVKNPNQPVTNVNFRDAMVFCSQLSIRDNLEPYYMVNQSENGRVIGRTTNYYASGYRLAWIDEWKYAGDKIAGMGNFPEYVNDLTYDFDRDPPPTYAQYMANTAPGRIPPLSGSVNNVYPVIRLVRPILDYWKYTSEE